LRGNTPLSCTAGIFAIYQRQRCLPHTIRSPPLSRKPDIPRDTIKPESHAIDDLGIDSLDFLDIAFAIDKAFGIKMPLEKWTGGQRRQGDHRAVLRSENLADRIDELVAAKNAGTSTGS
jgi:acyl carrier protein